MMPLEEVAAERGLDVEDVLEFLHDFLYYARGESLPKIQNALAAGDRDALKILAHSIKGAALNLHLNAIAEAALQIEEAAGSGNLEHVDELLDSVKRQLVSLDHFLRNALRQ